MPSHLNYADPIINGDTSVSVIYHIMDAEGNLWRSAPSLLVNALKGDGIKSGDFINANGEWLRIPTMRHLLPGTVAQIEIYIQRDGIDLQLYQVLENDPTIDYIDWSINANTDVISSPNEILAAAGAGELEYTTGGALANDPPPQTKCMTLWRNRAFCCKGNSIYPSQEFALGLGIQWSNILRFEWNDGTGDILGICPIDWNYCALFKRDAIGIFSGPGPDGVGRGNYVVQTLQTKMGLYNEKAIVNGADGCYFQDLATQRLVALTPQLNPQECMLGWFNETGATVVAAMQVEQKRQVWFGTSEGQIIVLDYKHKTQTSPFGQVFVWQLPSYGKSITGMTIIADMPTVLLSDGSLVGYYETHPKDEMANGDSSAILQSLETGELQPAQLQGMFDVSRVQVLGEYLSAHSLRMTVIPQFGTSGDVVTKVFSAAPEQMVHRPAWCTRVQSVRVRLEELAVTAGTPPATVYGKGLEFVGFALEIQPRGKLQLLDAGRVV